MVHSLLVVNEVLLAHGHIHWLTWLPLCCSHRAEFNRDCEALEADFCCLSMSRERLLTSGLH